MHSNTYSCMYVCMYVYIILWYIIRSYFHNFGCVFKSFFTLHWAKLIFLCSLACSARINFPKFFPLFSTEAEKEKIYHCIHNFDSHCMYDGGKWRKWISLAPRVPSLIPSSVNFFSDFLWNSSFLICFHTDRMANKGSKYHWLIGYQVWFPVA